MRTNGIYWFIIIISLAGVVSCNVCNDKGATKDAEIRDIYFNSKNLNNESINILAINAEGSNLEEVLNDAILFAPPSKFAQIVYKNNYDAKKLFLRNLKKRKSYEIKIDNSTELLSNPQISNDGRYIIASKERFNLVIIKNEYDSVFTNYYRTKTLDAHSFRYSIAPSSQKIIFFTYSDDKVLANIFDIDTKTIESSFTIYQALDNEIVLKIAWSKDSKYIYYCNDEDSINYLFKRNVATGVETKYKLGAIALDEISPISENRLMASTSSGSIASISLANDTISSMETICEAKQDEQCCNLSYNEKNGKLIFNKIIKNSKPLQNGNLYYYDLNTEKIKYIFSNAGAAFWTDM